jgi:hypothetical protein
MAKTTAGWRAEFWGGICAAAVGAAGTITVAIIDRPTCKTYPVCDRLAAIAAAPQAQVTLTHEMRVQLAKCLKEQS